MVKSILYDTVLQTPILKSLARKATMLSNNRWIPWVLFILSIIRNIILILTYPPAHGSDSYTYFLFAARLNGLDVPLVGNFAYPLYPVLIQVSFNILGSIYWLILLQFLMSALMSPLYYFILKPFSSNLALITSLIILGNPQVSLMFNFTSTEPLYFFIMAFTFYIFPLQPAQIIVKNISLKDLLLGFLIGLLLLTRSVARFLIIPLALIFTVKTRSLLRTTLLMMGFIIALAIYVLISRISIGDVEGLNSGNYMVAALLIEHPEWVSAQNGSASARWLQLLQICPDNSKFISCANKSLGDWQQTINLFTDATKETILHNLPLYISNTWSKTMNFLSLSSLAYGIDKDTPSDVQCADLDKRIATSTNRQIADSTVANIFGLASEEQLALARPQLESILKAMCPPFPKLPQLKAIIDAISFRYRSLGRPQPYLWYGLLTLIVVTLPWARRYMILVLTIGSVLLYHAFISALISNVQSRYVVVTDPLRSILLCTLIYLGFKLGFNGLDWIISRRKTPQNKIPST